MGCYYWLMWEFTCWKLIWDSKKYTLGSIFRVESIFCTFKSVEDRFLIKRGWFVKSLFSKLKFPWFAYKCWMIYMWFWLTKALFNIEMCPKDVFRGFRTLRVAVWPFWTYSNVIFLLIVALFPENFLSKKKHDQMYGPNETRDGLER